MLRPFVPSLWSLIPLLALTACSEGEINPGAHHFTRTEEDGISVSLSAGGPKYEGEIFTYEEIGRLEQDESREEALLFQVREYRLGEDGCYYVCDMGNGRIAVFDEQGRYQRCFGRRGAGPGEFQYPQIIDIRDGMIVIFDSSNRRASRFLTDGTFLEHVGLPISMMSARLLHPLADGRRVILTSDTEGGPGDIMRTNMTCLVVSAGDDTLASVATPWTEMGRMILIGNVGISTREMYSPQSRLEYRPGIGILYWDNSRPELTWYDLSGRVARIHRFDWTAEPIGEAARAGMRRSREYPLENLEREDMRSMYEAQLKHLEIADVYPFWSDLRLDDAGYHWLRRSLDYATWEPDWSYNYSFEVISPEGEHLGRSTFPDNSGILSRGHLLTMQEDEVTGEIAYIIYRLQPLPAGFTYP